ncbi:MAG: domain S-box/diguanylate cyclase domain [Anaerocolumna sp.]|nr:domain S-box/diguanylate cyclase domain [Anaerocolumna sp.]
MPNRNELENERNQLSEIAKDIEKAIVKEEFTLYYQPQFDLKTGKITGMEALVRWIHPVRGMISPAIFIPFAEESKQIYALEKWIFRNALQQKAQWEKDGRRHLELAINISSKTLGSEAAFHEIEEIMLRYKVDYTSVVIEITETALLVDMELAAKRVHRLKKFGVKIALDDFGTGYSSLMHLKTLPIDIIKIDRSFVALVPEEEKDTIIIKNIVSFARDLKYRVVAEGIEKQEQLEFLREISCESGQGFLLCKPIRCQAP